MSYTEERERVLVEPTREGSLINESTPRPSHGWHPSRRTLIVLLALATVIFLIVSLVSGSAKKSGVDPVKQSGSSVVAQGGKVLQTYLKDLATWNDCMKKHPPSSSGTASSATTSPCGALPKQPDDPQVNAYLADVLTWNKCAAPLLKRGARAQAVTACGPEPTAPSAG